MTSDHLLRLVEESHEGFRKGQVTASLFLDAEAAFDKCWTETADDVDGFSLAHDILDRDASLPVISSVSPAGGCCWLRSSSALMLGI